MKCLQPARLGNLALRNRLVMPPMVTNYAASDGSITDRYVQYIEARAKGGIGLIIIEATCVHLSGKGFPNGVCIHDDAHISGLSRLVAAAHAHGAKIAIQLHHAGHQTSSTVTGRELIGPSAWHGPGEPARAMTIEEIDTLIEAFGQAARRAREAGFDAVEIHGAHGYLITQFCSRYSNQRTDAYGGSIANRARFARQIIRRVRQEVGTAFTVLFRMSSDEGVPCGITIDEAEALVEELVQEQVDAFHISAGNYENVPIMIPQMAMEPGVNVERAAAIRARLAGRAAVIVAGRMHTLDLAERTINSGAADFVALGRTLLADPELPAKAARGAFTAIRGCVACNDGCIGRLFEGLAIGCALNPTTGHEAERDLDKPSPTPRKVLVIGAGPAGLEAARVAALRGHAVKVHEQEGDIGGSLAVAALPPYKQELARYITFLRHELHRLDVPVTLNHTMNAATVQALEPDVVIVATGGEPIIDRVPGSPTIALVTAQDVLTGRAHVAGRMLVLGGGLVGAETAEALALAGNDVTVVEMRPALAQDMEGVGRELLMRRLANIKVTMHTGTRVNHLTATGASCTDVAGPLELEGFDAIVLAMGARPQTQLADELRALGLHTVSVGDCTTPGKLYAAVHAAFAAAYAL